MRSILASAALATCLSPVAALGQAPGDIRVEVSHGNATDFSITPVWFGFHNGAFDTFDVGSAASAAVETIAEVGDPGPITADFTNAPGIPGDFQGVVLGDGNGVPPIEPGESGVTYLTPANPSAYGYFSFLSMVVPSNDTFIGNDDPLAYQVFDAASQLIDENGLPTNQRVIQIFGSDIYDAGTEVNGGGGAAFLAGEVGTEGTDQNGVITLGSDLSSVIGGSDPTGRTINDDLAAGELLATITISVVPEPGAALLAVVAGLGALGRRR